LIALVASGRWLLAAGFSPLWGALTFPLAACATASMLALGTPGLWIGTVLMVAASALNPVVAQKVLKMWAKGQLAVKTNAATA
jgi:tellurite resistance protein